MAPKADSLTLVAVFLISFLATLVVVGVIVHYELSSTLVAIGRGGGGFTPKQQLHEFESRQRSLIDKIKLSWRRFRQKTSPQDTEATNGRKTGSREPSHYTAFEFTPPPQNRLCHATRPFPGLNIIRHPSSLDCPGLCANPELSNSWYTDCGRNNNPTVPELARVRRCLYESPMGRDIVQEKEEKKEGRCNSLDATRAAVDVEILQAIHLKYGGMRDQSSSSSKE